jgi:tetratricopeptide (TPR) repeat protein
MRIAPVPRFPRKAVFLLGLTGIVGFAPAAYAQRGKKEPLEFTRQGLLIVNFIPAAGADLRLGRRAADAVRSRVAKLVNKKEVEVIDGDDIRTQLERAGYSPDTTFSDGEAHAIGRFLRADEFLVAYVANGPSGPQLYGHLILLRDEHLRQPLPTVSATKLDSAAQLFAKSIAAARNQLVPERRCENALREGSGLRAVAAARDGVAAFPQATIARTCLVWALRQMKSASNDLLTVSREILAQDSTNIHALEGAATALDSLRRRDEAATMWLKLANTDTANVELSLRISFALFDGGNSKRAEPFITSLVEKHPDDIRLVQQQWRIAFENKSWPHALEAGETLLAKDPEAQGDSLFYLRLATAYHASNKPYKAIETLAHGVSSFPKDVRLYSLYTQYLKAEADTVIPRGLALFPQSADLLALNAKELRARGKLAESLDATKRAVELDSTMAQGRLTVAQLEIELGRPDSALVALRRAVASGEDSSLVAQFALSKGNTFYRAANATKISSDFGLALRFLSFADSVRSTQQSKFLIGATAFGIAQSALTEATKVKDKTESCRLARLGADMIPMARTGLHAGEEMFAEAAKQSLEYLDQLDPYVAQELAAYCGEKPPGR